MDESKFFNNHDAAPTQEKRITPEMGTQIYKALETALANARSDKEHHDIERQIDEATNRFLKGEISLAEHDAIKESLEKPDNGLVTFKSLEEFQLALRLLQLPEEAITEIVTHEAEHAKALEEHGLDALYCIQLSKTADGTTGIAPSVEGTFSDGMDENEARRIAKAVTMAPEELSPSDSRVIDGLES